MYNDYQEMQNLNYVVAVESDQIKPENIKTDPNCFDQPDLIDLTTLPPSPPSHHYQSDFDNEFKHIMEAVSVTNNFSESNALAVSHPKSDNTLLAYPGNSRLTPPLTPDHTDSTNMYYTLEASNYTGVNNGMYVMTNEYGNDPNYPVIQNPNNPVVTIPINYSHYQQYPSAYTVIMPQDLYHGQPAVHSVLTIPTPEPSPEEPSPTFVPYESAIPDQPIGSDNGLSASDSKTTVYVSLNRGKRKRDYLKYDGEYTCELCDRTFARSSTLKQHNNTKHSGPRQHRCSQCGKRYQFLAELEAHEKRHKPSEKHFVCPECPRRFYRQMDMRRHFNQHHGQNDFQCPQCGRKYGRRDQLRVHLLCHAKQTDRRKNCLTEQVLGKLEDNSIVG
ncbi:zinc finger protein 629-like [Wyeomyia smithii]|uniref:zinc finger protein 629-like n=1 Tax=Wyeomyia smithii TaxID=174621 RepID=UPI002467B909|nr:zinc finger protein 629-like [Wyeomyia smithii]